MAKVFLQTSPGISYWLGAYFLTIVSTTIT